MAEMKRRRDEDKGKRGAINYVYCLNKFCSTGKILSHQNGEMLEPPIHSTREKHHRSRVNILI